MKALAYLQDLVIEGNTDICVFHAIGEGRQWLHAREDCFRNLFDTNTNNNPFETIKYDHLAIELGYGQPYISIDKPGQDDAHSVRLDKDRALLSLLVALENGTDEKDERILGWVYDSLNEFDFEEYPSSPLLGRFKRKDEMLLRYCDLLRQKELPLGYDKMGTIYLNGEVGIPKDEAKAVAIWEEGDSKGLLYFSTYIQLQIAYMYVIVTTCVLI